MSVRIRSKLAAHDKEHLLQDISEESLLWGSIAIATIAFTNEHSLQGGHATHAFLWPRIGTIACFKITVLFLKLGLDSDLVVSSSEAVSLLHSK